MAKSACQAGARFVAGADPRLVGCTSLVEHPEPDDWDWSPAPEDAAAWQSVRSLTEAPWVGLAMPRFLLRLPYGRKTAPTEQFPFDEMPGQPDHAAYLWGNPALACALLLGQAFLASGWHMSPGEVRDIDDLPVCAYPAEGEMVMQPCAEILLVDRAVQAIVDRGIMPLRSFAHRGAVRLERFQSIALPTAPLSGRWR
jgi:type VI secretion system protein ImpC